MLTTSVRFPPESERLLEAMKKSAANNRRSLNSELLCAIEFYLREAPEAHYETTPAQKEVAKKKSKAP